MNNAQRIVHDVATFQLQGEGKVRLIVLKARQEGISTYVAGRFFRRCTMEPAQYASILADIEKRSQLLFDIYERYYLELPKELKPTKRYGTKQRMLWFGVPEKDRARLGPGLDSKIEIATAGDPDAGRAGTLQLLHASEMAAWKNAEDVWLAVTNSVPDNGSEIIIESTAKGMGNLFHRMWVEAEAGESPYIPIFLPWWIHEEYSVPDIMPQERESIVDSQDPFERMAQDEGILWRDPRQVVRNPSYNGERHKLTPNQLLWRRQAIKAKALGDPSLFGQENPATPEEAFLATGEMFFDRKALQDYMDNVVRPPLTRGNLVRRAGAIVFADEPRGGLVVWEQPNSNSVYVVSADTAEGKQVTVVESRSASDVYQERSGRDYNSADVIDATNDKLVAHIHGRQDPYVFAQQLFDLGMWYATPLKGQGRELPAMIVVERNHSSGETVLKYLKENLRYPRLYYQRKFLQRTQEVQEKAGWITSHENRQEMLDYLAWMLKSGQIDIPSADHIREMYTFVRAEDGKPQATEGTHDDRVMSLALGMAITRFVKNITLNQNMPEPEFTRHGVSNWRVKV